MDASNKKILIMTVCAVGGIAAGGAIVNVVKKGASVPPEIQTRYVNEGQSTQTPLAPPPEIPLQILNFNQSPAIGRSSGVGDFVYYSEGYKSGPRIEDKSVLNSLVETIGDIFGFDFSDSSTNPLSIDARNTYDNSHRNMASTSQSFSPYAVYNISQNAEGDGGGSDGCCNCSGDSNGIIGNVEKSPAWFQDYFWRSAMFEHMGLNRYAPDVEPNAGLKNLVLMQGTFYSPEVEQAASLIDPTIENAITNSFFDSALPSFGI